MAETTGIINGTLMAIYVGGVKVAVLTSNSISESKPTRETANKDVSSWVTRLPNRGSWSASGSAFFQFEDSETDGYSLLKTTKDAGSAVTVMISSETAGNRYYSGSGYITQLDATFPDDDNSTYDFTIEGSGALTEYENT